MAEPTHVRKLLVLGGPSLSGQGIVDLLKEHFDVHVVQEMEQALEAMRKTPEIDAVLAETADFLPLERGVVTQQAPVVDAASHRRQQSKLDAIDRAGRELVRLDQESLANLDAVGRLQLVADRIIRCSREVLNYGHFAVFLLDARANRLECIISEGLDKSKHNLELFVGTEGNGICGYVAATGQSYICRDVTGEARYISGFAGARSSLTVPLRLHDKVIGVLDVESDRAGAFGEEDRQFAEIFANYVALALHILNLLVFERHTTHTQVSGSISAELAGPLNDIVTNLSDLLEEYIGHDDLRSRLEAIIDQATAARKLLQQMVDCSRTGVFGGAASGAAEKDDPVLMGRRVLVADDEELIRQTIGDVLKSYGCQVKLAASGSEAIDMIRAETFDLVISDIKMPGADGYEVFAAARATAATAKVVLMTAFGYDPHHSIVRANRQGLSAVLMKPFKVKQLLDECRTALTSA
jgi:CheY-like chemotaxis protein